MVARGLEAYAQKFGVDTELWYITGLFHDLDYFEYPVEHPNKSIEWFKEKEYSTALIQAVTAHAHDRTSVEPKTRLGAAICAVDEMSGFLYAHSLMRPNGFEGMEVPSVKRKFKDKAFSAKIDRDEIKYGIEKLNVDLEDQTKFLVQVFQQGY